jgi:type IV pilus assembly protein PilM
MAKSSPSAMVGLDIGTDLIKVVEAKRKKNAISLSSVGVAPIPEGAIENGVIVDPQAIGLAIKELLKSAGIKTRTVVSSVSGQSSVVVRVIDMPQMTPKELSDQMKFEVEKQTVFSSSEVVMDYATLEQGAAAQSGSQTGMKVLMAAAHQDIVNTHLEVLAAAGLKPVAIDIEPLALSRALIEVSANGLKNAIVGVVNIGSEKSEFGIFEGGELTYPSAPIPIAGVNITRAIGVALNDSNENCELLKKQHGQIDLNRIQSFSGGYSSGIGFGNMGQEEEVDFSSPINFFGADDSNAGPAPASPFAPGASEPETPFSPISPDADNNPFSSPFDFGESEPEAEQKQEPAEPEQPEPQPIQFKDTVDGPLFDLGDDEAAEGASPSFDLPEDTPQAAAPADEQSTQDQPKASSPVAFNFDLSDGDEQVDFSAAGEPTMMGAEAASTAPEGEATVFDTFGQADEPDQFASSPQNEAVAQQVQDAMAPVLMELAAELRRSIEYYATKSQAPVEKLFITGGTAMIKNLDKFLTNELGLPVEVADPVKNVPVTSGRFSESYLKEISPLLTVSIGLAIRDML